MKKNTKNMNFEKKTKKFEEVHKISLKKAREIRKKLCILKNILNPKKVNVFEKGVKER